MTVRRFLTIATLAATTALSGTAALAQQAELSPGAHSIAAVVNNDIITSHDLNQRIMFMLATTGVERTEESLIRVQNTALRNLVDEHLQMQEAERYDLTVDDRDVNQAVARLISRNGLDPQDVVQRLASAGVSIETLRDQQRSDVAWQRLTNGLFGSRIRISDSVIDETLSRLTANASKPSYRVAEIYIEATPEIGGAEGAMQGAQAMIAQVAQGAPFPLLAQQFSSAPSAAAGGDIGWVKKGEMRPEIDAVLDLLDTNEVSEPIVVPGGVYVVALMEKKISTSDTLYDLRQVTIEGDGAVDQLVALQGKLVGCDTVEDEVEAMDGVSTADMGELKASEMNELLLEKISTVEIGQLSSPVERPNGATSIMVCDRTTTGSEIPTRDEIENRLINTQLAQASRRHLRDLRRKATITVRS